jgi:hypothetical protein
MSTVQRINFEPFSDILATQRRDFVLGDKTLADPMNAVALVDGEWMVINNSYQIERATSIVGANGDVPAVAQTSYVLFAERGRTDVRAMGVPKMPLLFMGPFEGDTRIFDSTQSAATDGAPITYVGQPLQVATITIGTRKYTGLVGRTATGTTAIVGRVTRLPSNNSGKLRFVRASSI